MRKIVLFITIIYVMIQVNTSFGADWLTWRGPKHNGISNETNWSPKAIINPEKKWEKELGNGWTAVSTQGNLLYTMGNIDNKDIVYCLNVDTGKEVWRYSYKCNAGNFPGPRATPVIDGTNVYVFSREGHVFCLNAKKGTVKWQKNVMADYGARNIRWGFSSTPRIEGNVVLLNACTHGVALNKITGEKIWASQPGKCGYAVPVVYTKNNKKCIAIFGEKDIYGVDFKTGKKLWSYPWQTKYDINAADPIVIDNKVFISSGYGRGCALLDISTNTPKVVWENKNMSSHFSSPIYLDGFIYGSDSNVGDRRSSLNCIDAKSGELVWSQNLGFNSIIAVSGKLIALNERGELFIAEATSKGYKQLATATVLQTSKKNPSWTAPVLSNGLLYCRTGFGTLVCIDMKNK